MRRGVLLLAIVLTAGILVWKAGWLSPAGGDRPSSPAGSAFGNTATSAGAVQAYVEFASALKGTPDATLDAKVVADGFRALAGALGAVGATEPDATVDLRVSAELLLLNPASADVSAGARDALVKAAAALAARGASAPGIQQAAERISASSPLVEQAEAMRAFFGQAADAFGALETAGGAPAA